MRFTELNISGFGGVAGEITIDLDADVVVVVGSNGYGKTTICNAISWALSGRSENSQGPRNLYSKSGATAVKLGVAISGCPAIIVRSLDNPDEPDPEKLTSTLRVLLGERALINHEAERWVIRNLIGVESDASEQSSVHSVVDSVYLKQESLRQFLTGRADTERFNAVAEMVGAGRLQEFASQLDSQKRAWVRATTQLDSALDNERESLNDSVALRKSLEAEIALAETPEIRERWSNWITECSSIVSQAVADTNSQPSEQALKNAQNSLTLAKSKIEQKISALIALRAELEIPIPSSPPKKEMDSLESRAASLKQSKDTAAAELKTLRGSLEESEEHVRRAESLREDLASVASILLRRVSDHCAACGQSVDEEDYAQRLELMVSASADADLRSDIEETRLRLGRKDVELQKLQDDLKVISTEIEVLLEQRAAAKAAARRRRERLNEVLMMSSARPISPSEDPTDGLRIIRDEIEKLEQRRARIDSISETGLQFESVALLESAKARRERLAAEIDEQQSSLRVKERDLAGRRRTNDLASELLNQVKADSESFVAKRLSSLQPLLTQFYSAIDPHPTFRSVTISTRQFRGKRLLTPEVRDDERDIRVAEPGETLSTSQANALAVSLFLSFNLGFCPSKLETLILDDPLQNLDDVHLLGLVDLLRKLVPHRQLIVTTHDQAFAGLLSRKLRPVRPDFRTTLIRFTKWDHRGPEHEQWDVPTEQSPLKLISA